MSRDQPPDPIASPEEAWPETAAMPLALPRVALKIGLLMLNFARAETLLETRRTPLPTAAADGQPGSLFRRFSAQAQSAGSETVLVKRLSGTLAVLDRFRDLLMFGVCGVSASGPGQPAQLNWMGRHAPDAERQADWIAPGRSRAVGAAGAARAGQIQEWELDTAMLHLGLAFRDLEQMNGRLAGS